MRGGDGAEVIYALRNNSDLADKIAYELAQEGQNLRGNYQRRLNSNPSLDYYFIMRDTPNNESLIVEYGFLDSKKDDVEQLKNNWENYAEAVVKAVMEYINKPYYTEDYYTVKKGDSLYSIAKKLGVTVSELKDVNNLTSNLVSIGQKLAIPSSEKDRFTYTVKKGDTLYKIANMYGISVDRLRDFNDLKNDSISIGDVLKIPTSTNDDTYTVKSGDTLYSIAQKLNINVSDLKELNNLTSDLLSIGQILKIPSDKNYEVYTVVAGDNLYKIADEFGTTVDSIKSLNNLTSNLLNIGQKLLIP